MIKHCGGPAVVRRWSGGGPAVVHQWSNVPMGAGGAPTVVRRWSGGGPVVGAGGGPWGTRAMRRRQFYSANGFVSGNRAIRNFFSVRRVIRDLKITQTSKFPNTLIHYNTKEPFAGCCQHHQRLPVQIFGNFCPYVLFMPTSIEIKSNIT
ncbi:hypothetical protein LXL04_007563 [Taraxacum kok-saghyz]